MLRIDTVETPIGPLHVALQGDALFGLRFETPFQGKQERTPVSEKLQAYFSGDLHALDDLKVDPEGTPFQRRVWAALREIPPGKTRSYGDLARQLGTHPRAVGSANGSNPVCIAIPCHRVIASDGKLCGYAWGEDRKRWLLSHERR